MNNATVIFLIVTVLAIVSTILLDIFYFSGVRQAIYESFDLNPCLRQYEKEKLYKQKVQTWNKRSLARFDRSSFHVFLQSNDWNYTQDLSMIHQETRCELFDLGTDQNLNKLYALQKDPHFFQLSIPISKIPNNVTFVNITVFDNYNYTIYKSSYYLFVSAEVSAFSINNMLKTELGKKLNKNLCSWNDCKTCSDLYNGIYKKGRCAIQLYLNDICIRIKHNSLDRADYNRFWILDDSEDLFLNDDKESGCYFNTINYDMGLTEWTPSTYLPYYKNDITITIRNVNDPIIELNNINYGCNTKFIFVDTCTNRFAYYCIQFFFFSLTFVISLLILFIIYLNLGRIFVKFLRHHYNHYYKGLDV